ncbi:MAG TPA: imidazole glycerol phosphate synthase subunit HisH [Candidatus Sulfotelmatobacter sp.]|nr:imidazole glycerol phosphate synthase subunit HisH [Candidatus Sulfotelmatobacter sp.]
MIAIVDYGAGNLVSVKKALDWLGQECVITSSPGDVMKASKIVLPGVGHFASTAALARSGLKDAIANAIACRTPFLGICVGMQWMFERSLESPETSGLGLLKGECEHFPASVKSPHVGWNQLEVNSSSRLLRGVPSASFVYFTHSFRVPVTETTVACCEYGGRFSAAVEREHIFGVQFHPEKSGETGLKILNNFCEF